MNNEENTQAQTEEKNPSDVTASGTRPLSEEPKDIPAGNPQGNNPSVSLRSTAPLSGEPEHEKTYTEAEVEKIVEKRLRKERASADEKAEEALARVAHLENREACFKAGIREDCIDDVITLASKLVGEKTDINKAVAKIAEKYPHFKNSADKLPTTGTKTKDNIGDISDDALRTAFGLGTKK